MSAYADRARILRVIPHQGSMCLWDEATHWEPTTIELRTHTHRDPAHPLRSDHQLRAVHLCEYGAQAMAVHGGLLACAQGRAAPPGMLVALRSIRLQVARIDDLPGALQCHAQCIAHSDSSQQYAFVIRYGNHVLAEGRAAAILQTTGETT